ncbi:MAG: hypothetical protein VX519_03905 [Myxococcota bacterium]|nr:hypothetical protein [Myxococcota bacterium]
MRLGLLVAALFVASGCTSVATMGGARTIPKGTVQVATSTSLQHRTNALSTGLGIAVPQQDLAFRYGKSEQVDVGLRFYLLGAYADFRYQFAQIGEWDVAVAPGIGGLVLPTPAYQGGVVDLVSPIRFQRDLNSPWNITLSSSVRIRETLTRLASGPAFSGTSSFMQVLMGAGVRLERPLRRVHLALTVDALIQPARAIPPALSAGVGFSWMRSPEKRKRAGRIWR